ncbi:MAG: acyl-CoA dehydrogenase family protein [Gordonia amarae]
MRALEITVDEVRESLRDYFTRTPGLVEVRGNRDQADSVPAPRGFDAGTWRLVAEQLGLIGLGAPEVWGGLGLDLPVLAAAAEECASSLYPGPVRASLVISAFLGTVDPDSRPVELVALIDRFLSGQAIAGLATGQPATGVPRYDGERVSGAFVAVTNGTCADLLIGEVDTAAGRAVALVDTSAGGTVRVPVRGIDLVTPIAGVEVTEAPAILVATDDDVECFRRISALLLAAEQVGGAEGALAGMVEYAKVREQFGTLIGTHQAIAHRCADTAVAITGARALVTATAEAEASGNTAESAQLVLLARAEAAEVFVAASDSYIQVSGGIGFTWEHDAHLYFRRARGTAAVGGTPAALRDQAVQVGCLDLIRT